MARKTKTRPRRLEDFEGYKAAADKLAELEKRRNAVETRLDEVRAKLELPKTITVTQKALALLGMTKKQQEESEEALRNEHAQLVEERLVIVEAMKLQEQEVKEQAGIASRELAELLWPEWRQLVDHMADCCRKLQKAADAESDFRETLANEGFSCYSDLEPLPLRPDDVLERWLTSYQEAITAPPEPPPARGKRAEQPAPKRPRETRTIEPGEEEPEEPRSGIEVIG